MPRQVSGLSKAAFWFSLVSFVAYLAAFVTPGWVVRQHLVLSRDTKYGLWYKYTYDGGWKSWNRPTESFKSCQAMFTLGLICLFVSFLASLFYTCIVKFVGRSAWRSVSLWFSVSAAVFIVIGLFVWRFKVAGSFEDVKMAYSFILATLVVVIQLVIVVIFAVDMRYAR